MSRFRRALQAWHGSPHDYDEFKDEAIGSGEGAQVYGHGHYLAEARPVAEGYRDRLTKARIHGDRNPHWTYNGHHIHSLLPNLTKSDDPMTIALRGLSNPKFVYKPRGFQSAVRNLRDTSASYARDYSPSHGIAVNYAAAADWMEENKDKFAYRKPELPDDLGRLYEVHVALGDDEILDWDTRIADQHPGLHKKLESVGVGEMYSRSSPPDYKVQPGSAVYRALSAKNGSAANATKTLLNAGIRGVRYRDAGSRAPSTDLYLDGEKIPAREWGNEAHAHRAALDGDWDRASMLAGLPSLKEGRIKTLEDLKKTIDANHGYRTLPTENNLPGWFEENKHRVQLKPSRGTYNYVVFDPKDIKIVRKYGLKNELIKDFGTEPVHLTNVEGDHQHG